MKNTKKNTASRKVLWLGFAVPEKVARMLFELDPLPAAQTQQFGWSFVRSLRHAFGDVILASSCPVQNFPLVRRLIFRGGAFESEGIKCIQLGFINCILLKQVTRFIACLWSVSPLVMCARVKLIFVHGVHTPYLLFSLLARCFGCCIVVVLTDPPGVQLASDGRLARLLKHVDAWLIKQLLNHVDAVIALAPDLVHRLAPGLPSLVFPGVLDSTKVFPKTRPNDRRCDWPVDVPFTILYAGGLTQAYGVDRLVEAVLGLESVTPICLKLFGRGDQEDKIRQLADEHTRISYGGFVDARTLMPELCAAHLLINPRPTCELFASMSFPSKLIEFLATGRPVLTTRIPSMPEAMRDHFYYIEDESVEGIRSAIYSLMVTTSREICERGYSAQQFVGAHLSEFATGRKILKFINHLDCGSSTV